MFIVLKDKTGKNLVVNTNHIAKIVPCTNTESSFKSKITFNCADRLVCDVEFSSETVDEIFARIEGSYSMPVVEKKDEVTSSLIPPTGNTITKK